MRRLAISITSFCLLCLLIMLAATGRSGQAQVSALPTPKGQLGGAVRLTTPPVAPPAVITPTFAKTSIVGSWLVTVSPVAMPPAPATPTAAVPPLLLTFAADGTLTGSVGSAEGASLHGAWGTAANGSIYLRAVWLTFATNGSYATTVELTGSVTLDGSGNGWNGQFVEQELRPHGRTSGPLSVHGSRITGQPGPLHPPFAATPGT